MINPENIISTIGAVAPIINTMISSFTGNNKANKNTSIPEKRVEQYEEIYDEKGLVQTRSVDSELFTIEKDIKKNNVTINFNIYINLPKQ